MKTGTCLRVEVSYVVQVTRNGLSEDFGEITYGERWEWRPLPVEDGTVIFFGADDLRNVVAAIERVTALDETLMLAVRSAIRSKRRKAK